MKKKVFMSYYVASDPFCFDAKSRHSAQFLIQKNKSCRILNSIENLGKIELIWMELFQNNFLNVIFLLG